MTIAEVNAVVAKRLVKIDHTFRVEALALDVEMLSALQARTFTTAMKGDIGAVHGVLKIAERRAFGCVW